MKVLYSVQPHSTSMKWFYKENPSKTAQPKRDSRVKRRTCQNGGKSFAIEKISEQYSMKFGFLVKHTPRDLGFKE